jgi:HSP90 family molecular chaperone
LSDEELVEQEENERKEREEKEAKGETYEPKEKKTTKEVEVKVEEWKPVNIEKAIWMKEISKVTPEEYKEFYKTFDKDFGEPLDWIHFKVEGEIEFTALIYVPKVLPYMAMMRQF